jgi:hypothetical protein
MIDPEIPDDAGKIVEGAFSDDVEIFTALESMADNAELDAEAFASRVMEVIELEDLFDQD